jgi:hypothetical protein
MTVNTAAGTKIFIGPQAEATLDTIVEYDALSYTELGEVEDIGEFGDQANPVNFTALADGRVRKLKGSMDAGNLQAIVGFDGNDAGQLLLPAALASKKDYAFKVVLNDGADGSPSQDTVFYFRGKVMSKTVNPGSVDNIVRSTVNIGINSEILEKRAV